MGAGKQQGGRGDAGSGKGRVNFLYSTLLLPLENGEAAFLEAIEETLHKVGVERVAWRQRVFGFATDRLHDPSLLEANRALFLQAVAGKA